MKRIEIKNLTFKYPLSSENALNGVSITINKGDYIAVCGKSGCGKTTLLRHLKPAVTPHGERTGEILFDDENIGSLSLRRQTAEIGFVMQNPDSQIVTDKVWHELAFGLENLGTDSSTIRQKTAEMADYFGISHWFRRDVNTLSGGEKQLLNLASVMAMDPEILLLDEPVSQLDPVAAADFLSTVSRLNRELGVTVVITEHRLEEIFPNADRIVVMDKGKIISDLPPSETGMRLSENLSFIRYAMPAPMRIYSQVGDTSEKCPVTVRDGRRWLQKLNENGKYLKIDRTIPPETEISVSIKDLFFCYDKKDADVLSGLTANFQSGKITCILGGNGSGKSTLLKLVAGIYNPISGKIKISKALQPDKARRSKRKGSEQRGRAKTAYLPQQAVTLFTEKTVERDLRLMSDDISEAVKLTETENILDCHPFDLSGGEIQRAATAKILLADPDIILLDEPTKGLDGEFKASFGKILRTLANSGKTVIVVSHDTEFCSLYADVCMMLFDGKIVSSKNSCEFFSENTFYTTTAHKMSKGIFENAVTDKEVAYLCRKNLTK
ncbi:MAG: ATP-binding cassette domain-containing protein [Clostridiales bacterium]|nr:ATP-binding cassette domain-containing protein [Clostridiales bacterium]